jgi:peptidoglycan/LPS O-acetylase OafA/YrhL
MNRLRAFFSADRLVGSWLQTFKPWRLTLPAEPAVAVIATLASHKRRHLPGIHGLRAAAALIIVAFHVCYISRPALDLPALLIPSVYNMQMAVHLFFILSIFSLLHSYEGASLYRGWMVSYGVKRFFRIAPLFYVMLAYNYGTPVTSRSAAVVADALFIYNFIPGLHQSGIWAGWTLGVEMPVYVLLPLVIARFRTLPQIAILTAVAVVISICSRLLLSNTSLPQDYAHLALPSNVAIFAVGALAYHVVKAHGSNARLQFAIMTTSILGLAALATITGRLSTSGAHLDVLLWSIPLGLLCIWQATRPSRALSSRPMQWIGEREAWALPQAPVPQPGVRLQGMGSSGVD